MIRSRVGDFAGAIPILEAAVKTVPPPVDALVELGFCYYRADQNERSIQTLKRALAIEPSHPLGNYYYGVALYKAGRVTPAIQALRRAVDGDPSLADASYSLGMLYEAQGEKARALTAYASALKARPDYTEASAAIARLGGSAPEAAVGSPRLDGGQSMR